MKEMFNEFKNAYNENPKEFLQDVGGAILLFGVMWFLLWFTSTFCYDM